KLNVLVFPGEREAAIKSFTDLGAKILGEDRSPFGHQLIIDPSPPPSPREGRGSSAPMSSPAPSASPSPSPLNGERAGVRGENDPAARGEDISTVRGENGTAVTGGNSTLPSSSPSDILSALARLPLVQSIEIHHPR